MCTSIINAENESITSVRSLGTSCNIFLCSMISSRMSLKFFVKDVVSDEEMTLRVQIELGNGNTTKIPVHNILKECQMVWPHIKSTSCLVVHCGIVKSPNESLIVDIPRDSSKASVIYLYQTSDEVCKLCKFTVDDASIQAAQKWISSSTDPIHHVTCQLATTLLGR